MTSVRLRHLARRLGVLVERANLLTVPAVRLVEELRRRDVKLILDVGANDGGYGREIFEAGYSGEMISFEPLPEARKRLTHRIGATPGWTVAPALALSDVAGVATFHEAGNSSSSSLMQMNEAHVQAAPESAIARSFEVRTTPLDEIADSLGCDRPHFMKIDTQGSEGRVLSGAKKNMEFAVGVQIELSLLPLYEGQPLWRELDDYLGVNGFFLWDVIPGFRHRKTGQLMQFDGVYFRA